MTQNSIRTYLNLSPRYLRSTNLERDFNDKRSLECYVLTGHAQECLGRIAKGLRTGSTQRAWRVTGNYGSGKSSFALFLAHWFSGEATRLSKSTNVDVQYNRFALAHKPKFLPVLVSGSREPLGRALIRGVADLLDRQYQRGMKSALQLRLRAAERMERIPDNDVLKMLSEANEKLFHDGKSAGLLILLDELGKFLEFAAHHPQQQDVFLLQRLAEIACGSANDIPLFVIGMLHQGFDAYAENLDSASQREWEKIAGRFEEVVFNQPLLQVAELVAAALRVNTAALPQVAKQEAQSAWQSAAELGWLGARTNGRGLDAELSARIYPLHATVLPAMVRAFSRFGQNERSLFSFLMSDEPFALLSHCRAHVSAGACYRLHQFYDYVRTTFGYRLAAQSYRSHWTQIEAMVESFATANPIEQAVVKVVGILNLLDHPDLTPNDAALEAALGGFGGFDYEELHRAIDNLQKRRKVLFRRGSAGGYRLWPHTSVDLESAYERATRAVGTITAVARHLGSFVEDRPLIARRHYIETGNLRYFDVRYAQLAQLTDTLRIRSKADGSIFVLLCESPVEIELAEKMVKAPEMRVRTDLLLAIPEEPLSNHSGLVAEVLRWEWVSLNTPELNADRFAREEVSRQVQAARVRLQNRVDDLIALRSLSGARSLRWYLAGTLQRISDGRQLIRKISALCDERFPEAPTVKHELLNRHSLSSAAARARLLLIGGVLTRSSIAYLGMDPSKKPPEMSMYMSVLERGGLHVASGKSYKLRVPPEGADPLRLRPSLNALKSYLDERMDQRVRLPDLMSILARQPYGVRDGLAGLLVAVFAAIHTHQLAFYEEGSFLRELGPDEFHRLLKAPHAFEIQICRVSGLRADVFDSLRRVLGLPATRAAEPMVLEVVRPLCQFVAGLPDYSRVTKRLSPEAIRVREVILSARDPVQLLFKSLPDAMELEAITLSHRGAENRANQYANELKRCLDELRHGYDALQHRIVLALREELGCEGDLPEIRRSLSRRAKPLAVLAVEPRIKALVLRFTDDALADLAWLESLGSTVTSQPPARWRDIDEDAYRRELSVLAARFKALESMSFTRTASPSDDTAYRLAVTRSDGHEAQEVVYLDPTKALQVEKLVAELSRHLGGDRSIALAALSKVTWQTLERDNGRG